jgi:uncharacterized protein YggE
MVTRRIVSTAVMLTACAAPAAAAQGAGFIEVTGAGSGDIEADCAHVSFTVETRIDGAAAATDANTDAMERVLGTLRCGGLEGLSMATFGSSLRPEYVQGAADRTQARVIDGYTAVNNVRANVTVRFALGSGDSPR